MNDFVEKALLLADKAAWFGGAEPVFINDLRAHLEAHEVVVEKLVEALETTRRVLEIKGYVNAANIANDALALARGEKP